MEEIEKIEYNGKLLAIIVRKNFNKKGLTFVTDEKFSLQLGIHVQNKGFEVKPHSHIPFKELKNLEVQEIFYIEKGEICVSLYYNKKKVTDIKGYAGDVIILNSGHSLLCLNDSKFIEIKQGPYRGKNAEKEYIK